MTYSPTVRSPTQIGASIRDALHTLQISQADAARRIGFSTSYLGTLLAGNCRLSAEVASRLSLLGIDGMTLYLSQALYEYYEAIANEKNSAVQPPEPEIAVKTTQDRAQEKGELLLPAKP